MSTVAPPRPAPYLDVVALVDELSQLAPDVLQELAECGRELAPPAFRGRCLEPAFLEAVASGAWSLQDEDRLALFERHAERALLCRVARRHRRGLRTALRAVGVSVLTRDLPVAGWAQRRDDLVGAVDGVALRLPTMRCATG